MQNSYRNLREMLYNLAGEGISLIDKYVNSMDDVEFKKIPTLILSEESKKVIETYGCTFGIERKDANGIDGRKVHIIYCVFPTIFKIAS